MFVNVTEKPDCREGLAAFAEKRKPHYKHWLTISLVHLFFFK